MRVAQTNRQTFKDLVIVTFGDGPQDQNSRLFDDPVGVEEQAFQQGQQMRQQIITEHVGENIQSCS